MHRRPRVVPARALCALTFVRASLVWVVPAPADEPRFGYAYTADLLPNGSRTFACVVAFVGWLMLSAYLLYYLGDEDQRFVVSVLHRSVGLSCPVLFLAHRWRARAHPPGH